MPYTITTGHAACNGFAVVKDNDGEIMRFHKSETQAERQMAALYASEDDNDHIQLMTQKTPNRELAQEILANVSRGD